MTPSCPGKPPPLAVGRRNSCRGSTGVDGSTTTCPGKVQGPPTRLPPDCDPQQSVRWVGGAADHDRSREPARTGRGSSLAWRGRSPGKFQRQEVAVPARPYTTGQNRRSRPGTTRWPGPCTTRRPRARRTGHDVRSACDSERLTTVTHGQSWSLDGCRHQGTQSIFALVRALVTRPKLVVRDRIELSTLRFSGWQTTTSDPTGSIQCLPRSPGH